MRALVKAFQTRQWEERHSPVYGDAGPVLENIADATPIKAVFWNRLYDKPSTARDTEIKANASGSRPDM